MRRLFHHFTNPVHVCCRITDVAQFFGFNTTINRVRKSWIIRKYDSLYSSIAYCRG